MTSPEVRFLRRAFGVEVDGPAEPVDGRKLLALVRFHKVLPFIWPVCREAGLRDTPAISHFEVLETAHAKLRRTSERLIEATSPVIDALARRVPTILFKGAHIAEFAYSRDIPRPMGDIDVCVREAHVEDAVRICREHLTVPQLLPDRLRFYRSWRGQLALTNRATGASIDLHWWPNNSPLMDLACGFTTEALWARAQPASWYGAPVSFPSREDTLLMNAVYMSYENWFQVLRQFVDHGSIAAQASLPDTFARAREVGLTRVLAVSLLMWQAIFERSLPGGAELDLGSCTLSRGMQAKARRIWAGPSLATRTAHWGITERVSWSRYLVRTFECARIYGLTDVTRRRELAQRLLLPDPAMMRRLYLSDRVPAMAALHPFSVLIGCVAPGGPLGQRFIQP